MKIMSELGKYAPNSILISLLCGASAGLCYVCLIPLVLSSMRSPLGVEYEISSPTLVFGIEVANDKMALAFFSLCVLILILRTLSQVLLARITIGFTTKVRGKLYNKINSSPIDVLEKIGVSRIINVMTMDVKMIVEGTSAAPPILVHLSTIFGMLTYIWIMNSDVFYFVVLTLFFGILSYQIPIFIGHRYFFKTRNLMDNLQESFRALLYGAKELKLNKVKSDSFISNDLLAVESDIKSLNNKGDTILTAGTNYGDMLSFFAIGALSFIFINYHQVSNEELVAVIMIMLYISAPVGGILIMMPVFMQASISNQKMQEVFSQMSVDDGAQNYQPAPHWNEIVLTDVGYSYDEPGGFTVGPVNLTIKKGEITFIAGGNGSGKSTLSKLITLHYYPKFGKIKFDDVQIDKKNINIYRQNISSIYSDYYLFKSIHGVGLAQDELAYNVSELLHDLDLAEKVTFENGAFSTIKLSDGQKRRLALLVSFIEDKELYLFDEWAADQDPQFREVYYTKILPELKAKGKAIVVISHDDRYFHVADKIVKLEAGQSVTF